MDGSSLPGFDTFRATAGRWLGVLADGQVATLVAALAAAVVGVLWIRHRQRRRVRATVMTRRAFSSPEGALWRRIQRAMPEHVVLMGVPLERFLMVRQAGGLGGNARRLAGLSVDYAVFRGDGTISSVVLLADAELALPPRQRKLRQRLLERAQIRSVRWSVTTIPSVEAVAGALDPDPSALVAAEPPSARRRIGAAVAV